MDDEGTGNGAEISICAGTVVDVNGAGTVDVDGEVISIGAGSVVDGDVDGDVDVVDDNVVSIGAGTVDVDVSIDVGAGGTTDTETNGDSSSVGNSLYGFSDELTSIGISITLLSLTDIGLFCASKRDFNIAFTKSLSSYLLGSITPVSSILYNIAIDLFILHDI